MENPKQALIDAKFFEEESSKVLRTVLFLIVSLGLGTLAMLIVRKRKNIEKES